LSVVGGAALARGPFRPRGGAAAGGSFDWMSVTLRIAVWISLTRTFVSAGDGAGSAPYV
jgi:hypothetical protein